MPKQDNCVLLWSTERFVGRRAMSTLISSTDVCSGDDAGTQLEEGRER